MIYTREIFDRITGELITVSDGDWITLAELGQLYGLGRRKTTEVLRVLDVLVIENDNGTNRHRLADWFVQRGYGKRLYRKADRYPFHVISPSGQEWIAEMWSLAIEEIEATKKAGIVAEASAALEAFSVDRREMNAQMQVCWLVDHFPKLTETQVASIISVSQPLVNRYVSTRQGQLMEARKRKLAVLPVASSVKSDGVQAGPLWSEAA